MKATRRICVLGSGCWGTALSHHLRRAGHEVVVWGVEPDVLEEISSEGRHSTAFPGEALADGIETEVAMEKALSDVDLVIFAVPSSVVREVAKRAGVFVTGDAFVVSVAKGLESETFKPLSQVLEEELGAKERIGVLSGPSFALEVLRGLPTAVTLASSQLDVAKRLSGYFHYGNFRIYTSDDVKGVEFGGALKNIYALAAGIVDGAGMGLNARAALITRGLFEMGHLVETLGGRPDTVMGLSGLGDLLLTSTGDLSRNRRVGLRLGRGEELDLILRDIGQVAEGVATARKALLLARSMRVEVPIIEETVRVLSGEHSVREAVEALISRAPRVE